MSGNLGSSSGVLPEVPVPRNSFDVIWKGSELIKVEETIEGKQCVWYETPSVEFKELLWYLKLRSVTYLLDKTKHPSTWQTYFSTSGKVLTECLLKVSSKDKEKVVNFAGCAMITSTYSKNYKNEFDFEDTKTSTYTVFPRLELDKGTEGALIELWTEEEMVYETSISMNIVYLSDKITDHEVKFLKMQMPIMAQMKKDAKGVDLFLKLVQIDNDGDEKTGLPQPDFSIQAKNGKSEWFHKAVLKVRGGKFFKRCLKAGMVESLTSQLKWEAYDEEVVKGFKDYLYRGTIPNLSNHAFDFFKLADYCHFPQIRELAELELCKSISKSELGEEQAWEIIQSYETYHLYPEFNNFLAENPGKVGKFV